MTDVLSDVCWRTYNYKLDEEAETFQFVPLDEDERTLFREVVANRQDHGLIVMEHVGGRLAVQPGTFLGRVVAVARSRAQLEEDIRLGIRQLKESIRNSIQTSNPKEADK